MIKCYRRLSCYVLTLLVLTIPIGLWQVTSLAEEQPDQETPGRNQSPLTKPEGMSKMFEGTVMEVIDAGRHIYISVKTGEKLVWIAVADFDGKPGDEVLVPPGVPVSDLHSEKLNRSFKMIYFVGNIHKVDKNAAGNEKSILPESHSTTSPTQNRMIHPSMEDLTAGPAVDIGKVEKAKGGKTVFEIISESKNLAGKNILVRAKVTRFKPNIMGKNWLHVRDGSGDKGQNDLVVTTGDKARIGDLILIRGIVSVDRDFGFGKKYPVIVENAKITVE